MVWIGILAMTKSNNISVDRRSENRFYYGICPIYVRVVTAGQSLKIHTQIENISQSGIYLHLPHNPNEGERLFTVAKLPGSVSIASFGRILRVELKHENHFGVAVGIERSRIFAGPG